MSSALRASLAVRYRPLAAVAVLLLSQLACNTLLPPAATATPPPPTRPLILQPPTPTAPPPTSVPPTPTDVVAADGAVTGQIYYPASSILRLTLYFENQDDGTLIKAEIEQDQPTYTVALPPGTYHAYAWQPDYAVGGGYTTCNAANPACDDHTLLPIAVSASQVTADIDIYDWYGPPGFVPYPPGVSAPTGNIEGIVHYPAEAIPAMTLYARNVDTLNTHTVAVVDHQQTFTFEALPIGNYYVFAWVSGQPSLGGSYSQFVPCGLSVSCSDHSLISVPVSANQTTTGVDVADWYDQGSVPLP